MPVGDPAFLTDAHPECKNSHLLPDRCQHRQHPLRSVDEGVGRSNGQSPARRAPPQRRGNVIGMRNRIGDREPKGEGRRRVWIRYVGLLVVLSLLGTVAPLGCTTTIVPPRSTDEPTTVFVLDHGHTTSLVLPDASGDLLRYAFGDLNYYALGNDGAHRAAVALFWPTQGVLGRKRFAGPAESAAVERGVRSGIRQLHELQVERGRVDRLRTRLEQVFHEQRETLVVNESVDLTFVHYPQTYSYFYNSNHAVVDWLRELGCRVEGPAVYARWRVERDP